MNLEKSTNIGAAAAVERRTILEDLVERAKQIADDAPFEASETDSTDSFPVKTLSRFADAELLSAPLPKNHGGANLGLERGTNYALLQILKHCGRGNLVVGRVFEGHFNALLLIKLFGNGEQIETYAADAKNGKLFGVWNTEANDGVKISLLEKVSVIIDNSWWNPMGMRATRSFKTDFTGVEIGKENLIGAAGNYYEQPWFSGGSIRFAAVQFGAAEAIFDETRKYLQMLGRIDEPYQKMRLGEMAILTETGNLWLKSAAEKLDEFMANPSEIKSENFLAYANMMRSVIEKICVETMNLCQKCVGARGLNKPFHFERIIRDLTIYLRQPAPDAALADAGRYVLQNETAANDLWK